MGENNNKKVKITFAMESKGGSSYKFKRRTAVLGLPVEIAEDLENRQHKSRYVSNQPHNNPSRHLIAELIQIVAELHGYKKGIFEFAEIVGDDAE